MTHTHRLSPWRPGDDGGYGGGGGGEWNRRQMQSTQRGRIMGSRQGRELDWGGHQRRDICGGLGERGAERCPERGRRGVRERGVSEVDRGEEHMAAGVGVICGGNT